jgi:hypothetical protein
MKMPRVLFEFTGGGPLDGRTMDSASPDRMEARQVKDVFVAFRLGRCLA